MNSFRQDRDADKGTFTCCQGLGSVMFVGNGSLESSFFGRVYFHAMRYDRFQWNDYRRVKFVPSSYTLPFLLEIKVWYRTSGSSFQD